MVDVMIGGVVYYHQDGFLKGNGKPPHWATPGQRVVDSEGVQYEVVKLVRRGMLRSSMTWKVKVK